MQNANTPLSLKYYNTFGIDVNADEIIELTSLEQLNSIKDLDRALILGGGSNVLFTQDVNATVIVNRLKGISRSRLNDKEDLLEIASGEVWHDVVIDCVEQGLSGIENLSLIPGSVGAAPMQNIGAYGVEIKDVLVYVEAVDLQSLEIRRFTNEECEFGYRESIFKKALKGKYLISKVGLRLKREEHELNISYGAIKDVLQAQNIENPSIKDVSHAVISIRQSKLPDPKDIGNAGSFFKNPVISTKQFEALKISYPQIKYYVISDEHVKIPAGWLIESLGWKGKRVGNTGSHKQQALVLVNYGQAEGSEVRALSEEIKRSVVETYGIQLETEVNIL